MDPNTIPELERFAKDHGSNLHELSTILNNYKTIEEEKKLIETTDTNESLIGKCFYTIVKPYHGIFPEMKRFFKVLSNRSNNQYRVECLVFDEHPTYWFKYQMHKEHTIGDYYLGHFDFKSFSTESIMATTLQEMTEISSEEFTIYAYHCAVELLDTEWIPDHYRGGEILPSDPNWATQKRPTTSPHKTQNT
jgi:hypothetical protein